MNGDARSSSSMRTDARPFQRPGRRLRRLRHLSGIRGLLCVPRIFTTTQAQRTSASACLREHFDIVNLSKIPDPQHPQHHGRAADLALFRRSPADQARGEPARRAGVRRTLRHPHQHDASTARTFSPAARTWAYSRPSASRRTSADSTGWRNTTATRWTGPRPLSDQHPGLVGRRASVRAARLSRSSTTARSRPTTQTAASSRCSAINAPC